PGPERSPAGLGCGRLTVSAPTTVLTAHDRTRLELTAWPDTQPGVLRSNAGSYYFLAAGAVPGQFGRQHQTVTSGTLDDPVLHGIVARSSIEGLPAGFTYAGAGQVWRDPRTGTIGLARLDLPSFTATFLGTILRPAVTFEQADRLDATVDVGTPSLVARNGFLYIYFSDFGLTGSGLLATSLSIARTPLAAAVAAAQSGHVTSWAKYRDAAWLGGQGEFAGELAPGSPVMWEPSAAYDPALSRFVVVAPVSRSRVVLTQSADAVTGWSGQQILWDDPGRFDAYPIIVGMGADPAVPGATFYVYYLQWPSADGQDWSRAVQLRRTVTCLS
ncbi:MAG: hypothetical protein QOH14_3526, partial [Pseudonocardiales bacterium]|nr:hypothetical protein [Pseudonocardiales bacterium]